MTHAPDTAALSHAEIALLLDSPPRDDDELDYFCRKVLHLRIPRRPICPDHRAPFDYVRDAFFERFTDACIWANRGGGKTTLGAAVSVLDALFKPGVAVRILGGSLEQSQKMYRAATHLMQRGLADRLACGVDPLLGRRRGFTARTLRFGNDSEIEILAQSERSVRGNRVQKMRCDEVELFDTDVWSSCQLVTESREIRCEGRAAKDKGGLESDPSHLEPRPSTFLARGAVEAFSTFHRIGGLMAQIVEQAMQRPSPLYRWCVLDVLERCPPERRCQGCALAAECGGRARNADGFYRIDDAIAAKARVSTELWESEMLCLRPSRRGAVFPAFARQRHVAPVRIRPDWPIYRAIDFGFTNPFVCLWIQVAPGGDVFVVKEYLRSRVTLANHALAIREADPGLIRGTFCDPAGGQADQITGTSARAELRSFNIDTRARPSAITEGLEIIRRHLDGGPGGPGSPGSQGGNGGAMLRIDPSCERLIRALEAYRYPEPSERRGGNSELPLKDGVHDHPIDALRYFFVNHRPEPRVVERLY